MSEIKVGRPTVMRNVNKNIILKIIRKKSISKIELSRISGLKPPTVSNIINELLLEDTIEYCGKGDINKNGGPKPDLYKLNNKKHFFVGIDISRKKINGIIVDIEENIIARDFTDIKIDESVSVTKKIVNLINMLLNKSGLQLEKIFSVTISVAALVNVNESKIIESDIPELNGFDIKQLKESLASVEVYLDNDINLLLMGYNFENALCIGIRSGIGLGIITNGTIIRGEKGVSGNLNHYYANGDKLCKCGNIGCFETVLGEEALIELLSDYLKNDNVTIQDFYDTLLRNDTELISRVEKSLYQLAVFIGRMIQIFNPTHILIGGEIFYYCERLFDYIVSSSSEFYNHRAFDKDNFIKIQFQDETIANCAARYAVNEYFKL